MTLTSRKNSKATNTTWGISTCVKNLYIMLLPVNGCFFCWYIKLESKASFCKQACGEAWLSMMRFKWSLVCKVFVKYFKKYLCSKQVWKVLHLLIKRNSNETQHLGNIDQWYGRQIKQIKFSNICLGYIQCTKKVHSQTHRLSGNEVLDNSFRHLREPKTRVSLHVRPTAPIWFQGGNGLIICLEANFDTKQLYSYFITGWWPTLACTATCCFLRNTVTYKAQDKFGHNTMLVADLGLREKKVILNSCRCNTAFQRRIANFRENAPRIVF